MTVQCLGCGAIVDGTARNCQVCGRRAPSNRMTDAQALLALVVGIVVLTVVIALLT